MKPTKTIAGGPLMAVDALGRPTPDTASGAPKSKKNRLVGLFYFLWLGEHGRERLFDISKITDADPEAGYKLDSGLWGDIAEYHFWGEPFYGYYYSDDEWVARRHMKLIMQADVDFLFFDTTNAVVYENNVKMILRILQEYHDEGWKIPKIMFYTNSASGQTVQRIYEEIYQPGYCKDTWFYFDGKPVIIAVEEECSPETRAFFNIKMSQWPNEPDKLGGWPWMDFIRPQRVFSNLKGEPEVINVSVAQHPQLRFGDSVLYGETANRGRAFHNGQNDPTPDAYKHGYNFAEQFERAVAVDPPVLLITGWNEWIAARWDGTPERPLLFVDCANYEYSRDVEMMRGGYFDNFFMQMVSYIRKYKGIEDTPVYPALPAAEGNDIGCFCESPAVYHNFSDGDMPRAHGGQGGLWYENRTQRNTIEKIRVKHDDTYISFCIKCKANITPAVADGSWMQLFLNTTGSVGYDFVINRAPAADGTTTISKIAAHGDDLAATEISGATAYYEVKGSKCRIKIPRAALGLDHPNFTVWFKAADSTEAYASIEDFYDKGDVAPLGRLNYVYKGE